MFRSPAVGCCGHSHIHVQPPTRVGTRSLYICKLKTKHDICRASSQMSISKLLLVPFHFSQGLQCSGLQFRMGCYFCSIQFFPTITSSRNVNKHLSTERTSIRCGTTFFGSQISVGLSFVQALKVENNRRPCCCLATPTVVTYGASFFLIGHLSYHNTWSCSSAPEQTFPWSLNRI